MDNTADIVRNFADNHKHSVYFMSTSASNDTGKSQTLALPLVEGCYVYFVNANDSYDFGELAKAIDYVTKYKKNIMVLLYVIEYVDANKQKKTKGIMKSDDRVWTSVRVQPK